MKSYGLRITLEIVAALTFLFLPLLLVPVVTPIAGPSLLQPVLRGILMFHSLLIAFYFYNAYFAIPRLYFQDRRRLFMLLNLLILLGLIALMLSDLRHNPFPSPPFRYPVFIFITSIVLRFVIILIVSFAITSYGRLKRAEAERLRSELSFLKAQVNPHFLFNTLNSIYALVVTRSDKAPVAITKLAALMRYLIDEASMDQVPLEKELHYLSSYLELERLRLNEKATLTYRVEGSAAGRNVPPLLFLPLIENAFKHGVSVDEASFIEISVDIRDSEVVLAIRNSREPAAVPSKSGLGLTNLRRRLALLDPAKNTLSIEENPQYFSSVLKLALS